MPSATTLPTPQIHILGAGIASLVLTRALLARGFPASHLTLSDKAPASPLASPRNHHAITLHPASYAPLLPLLNLDDAAFRRAIAVCPGTTTRSGREGTGGGEGRAPFRANRGKLEMMLAEGVSVRWGKEVTEVKRRVRGDRKRGVEVRYRDGEVWSEEGVVVGADGVHSVVREGVGGAESEVLPFVVFNGKRKFGKGFEERLGQRGEVGEVVEERIGDVRLAVWMDGVEDEEVRVGYAYSRSERGETDALFRPRRAKGEAKHIPEGFFEEVEGLRGEMSQVFREIFDVEVMRKDRLLNWLMRRVPVNEGMMRLRDATEDGVVLMGDAAHAEAILGGNGANVAIEDGLHLAEMIRNEPAAERLQRFYDIRQKRWAESSAHSVVALQEMHIQGRSNL